MKLSIIIVNYNGKHFIKECFDSIVLHVHCSYEIILFDNNSCDGSIPYIQESFPNVRLIVSDKNLGFSAGNNRAIEYANGDYLLLLNNDTCLLDDISPMISILNDQKEIGIVGAYMLGKHGEYRHSAGYFPSPLRLLKFSYLYCTDDNFLMGNFSSSSSSYHAVDWIEGSLLLTRKKLWNQLNGMDENYFMYVEDVDYCKRANNANYKTVYMPHVSYIHYGGYSDDRMSLLIQSMRYYTRKFMAFFPSVLSNIILSGGLLLRLVIFGVCSLTRKSYFQKKVQGIWKAWSQSPW